MENDIYFLVPKSQLVSRIYYKTMPSLEGQNQWVSYQDLEVPGDTKQYHNLKVKERFHETPDYNTRT